MRKMQALYEYLIGTGLISAEQLRVVVPDGAVKFYAASEGNTDVAFIRNYTVQVIVSNWGASTEALDQLDVALVWWLSIYEPTCVGDKGGYGFEAELINKETANLYIEIPLQERVYYKGGQLISCTCPTLSALLQDSEVAPPPAFILDALHQYEVSNADA